MRSDLPICRYLLQATGILVLWLQGDILVHGQGLPGDEEVRRLPPVDEFEAPAWLKPEVKVAPEEDARKWLGDVELGVHGSEGNSVNFNLHAGLDAERKTAVGLLEVDVNYSKVTSGNVEIRHHALLDVEHKWLSQRPWTCFVHFAFDYDEFKAFDSRISTNGGADYHFLDTDITKFAGRLGAGFSYEIGGVLQEAVPEAVLGLQLKHRLTERQQLEAKVDYLPDWSDFQDFRVETDAGWKIALDADEQLSLKFELNDRYDNTPGGRRPNDLTYAVLLTWQL